MISSVSLCQRIRRTPYQAIASIFMIFLTLLVTGGFLLLASFSSSVLSYFETKPQLTIFFNDDKDENSVNQLLEKLKATGKVATAKYISKEEALNIYREQNKKDPLLLEMVTADILPSSLEVSASSPQYLSELAEIARKEPGIDEVIFQKDVVDALISWITTIRRVGIVFIFFLFFSTFFILLTSIGMKIALRKDEIEVLKLVGATDWYVKRPFILEGIIYGIIGAAIASLIITGLLLYSSPFIGSFLQGIPDLPLIHFNNTSVYIWPPTITLFVLLWVVLLLSGVLIGLIGSSFSVSRYMKT